MLSTVRRVTSNQPESMCVLIVGEGVLKTEQKHSDKRREMSLYNDYLLYNGFTEVTFQQRAVAAGYCLAVYRTEPAVEIWLTHSSIPSNLLVFYAHESAALFFEVLEGTETHEHIEEAFLRRFPTLDMNVSEESTCSWETWLPTISYTAPRHNSLLTWYRGAGDWMTYKDRVLSCSTGIAAERVFGLFEQEQERQFWILNRHGERLALNQTMHRLRGLNALWIKDIAEHHHIANKQLSLQMEWLD